MADRDYGKRIYRRTLRARGIPHTIPERTDHRERRATRRGRPLSFDANLYAKRNVVERCVNRLKRYEKQVLNYKAMVVIASLMIWLAQ